MTYSEKLKDPRWQKKRLEILERDNYTCRFCGDTTSILSVHHFRYEGEPWDVDNIDLISVCNKCHQEEHFEINYYKKLFLECLEKEGGSVIYKSLYNTCKNINDLNFPLSSFFKIIENSTAIDHGFFNKIIDIYIESISNLFRNKKVVTDAVVQTRH